VNGRKFMDIATEKREQIYEKMLLIRYFEEKVIHLFSTDVMHGTTHLYVGEEAVAAGVMAAMEPKDVMLSTHRGHGHCIAKGIDLGEMMAEMMGRQAGSCGGRGGSMHIADPQNGNLGSNGVVAGGIPLAVGAALAIKQKKTGQVAVCFFGDGATNQGSFHEALNLASVWKLPVLFVCEDNQYGLSTSRCSAMNISDIALRAQSYNIEGKSIDGNDAEAVYRESVKAIEYVRENGPMLLVCQTYRIYGHSKSDKNLYRTQEEIAQWKAKDPIARMKARLLADGFSAERLEQIDDCAIKDIEAALKFAEESPYPPADTVCDYVYA
jgi:pyruvate dehydrogenase E1 component alpha subunit